LFNKIPSKNNQTINDLLTVLPNVNSPHNNRSDELIYEEIKRELKNDYEYTLKAAFVSEKLIANPRTATIFGRPNPRVEQYRWMVRAEIEAHTYNAVTYPLTVNYDVVVNLYYQDMPFDGSFCLPKIIKQ